MGERYWISGVQLGILKTSIDKMAFGSKPTIKLIDEIEEKQFLGRIEESEKDTLEVRIVKRARK